jgi:dihydrofolate synthase/folylpolyglutamate synthase
MPTKSLAEWLDHQQRSHPRAIELGLERVRMVWERMGAPRVAPVVITVGGTNGKGSTVAFLEAMLGAAGKRVGCYTSPHLLRYNERVRLAGVEATDDALVAAFERIEAARTAAAEPVALTYFEYGTLAAVGMFAHAGLDTAVREGGLGGRRDAVHIIDADAAIVTTVDLDHQDWLGADRDSIGREKAGIFRAGRPAVIGSADAPAALLAEAARIGAKVVRAGTDYTFARTVAGWSWQSGATVLDLPLPALAAPCQVDNAAAALAALHCLRDRLGWDGGAQARGVAEANVAARLQRFARPGRAEVLVDVAHNPQAARVLAQWLREHPARGRTHTVFGALEDKDIEGIVEPFDRVDEWLLAGLDALTPRGTSPERLRERVARERPELARAQSCAGPADALRHARDHAAPADRIVAFGSFFVAAAALELLQE